MTSFTPLTARTLSRATEPSDDDDVSLDLLMTCKLHALALHVSRMTFNAVVFAGTNAARGRAESAQHVCKRTTHLHLQQRRLRGLTGIRACPQLRVIYAYRNHIAALPPDCAFLPLLSVLMLDENDIGVIEHLDACVELTKLYLDKNRIACLTGLDRCMNLRELHIARQRREEDEPLQIDSSTIRSLALSLEILDISGNGLSDITALAPLVKLRQCDLRDNAIELETDLAAVCSRWPALQEVDVRGNPCARSHSCRAVMVSACSGLLKLDGAVVRALEKCYSFTAGRNIMAANPSLLAIPELTEDDVAELRARRAEPVRHGPRRSFSTGARPPAVIKYTLAKADNGAVSVSFSPGVKPDAVPAVHYDPRVPTAAQGRRGLPIGTRSGFRSHHIVDAPDELAVAPVRTPSDFTRESRFYNSEYASFEDRLRAQKLKELERSMAQQRKITAAVAASAAPTKPLSAMKGSRHRNTIQTPVLVPTGRRTSFQEPETGSHAEEPANTDDAFASAVDVAGAQHSEAPVVEASEEFDVVPPALIPMSADGITRGDDERELPSPDMDAPDTMDGDDDPADPTNTADSA